MLDHKTLISICVSLVIPLQQCFLLMEIIWFIYLFTFLLRVTLLFCLANNASLVVNNNTTGNA